ncbi:MAG: hypothetical protein K2W95_15485 [Candidatus Obscuribacterales bacterium]|nr:hypothetical protein [Candidatus Obscuribacterales bacterium]
MTRMPYKAAIIACKKALRHHCLGKISCNRVNIRTQDYSSGGGGRIVNVTFEMNHRSFTLEEYQQLVSEFDAIVKTQLRENSKGWHGISTHFYFRDMTTGDLIRPGRAPAEELSNKEPEQALTLTQDAAVLKVSFTEDGSDQVMLELGEPFNLIKLLDPDVAANLGKELLFWSKMAEIQKQARPRSLT